DPQPGHAPAARKPGRHGATNPHPGDDDAVQRQPGEPAGDGGRRYRAGRPGDPPGNKRRAGPPGELESAEPGPGGGRAARGDRQQSYLVTPTPTSSRLEDLPMPQPLLKLLPIARLVELARTGPARTQPPYSRQSYPIPLRQEGGLRVAFLYAPHGRLDPAEG